MTTRPYELLARFRPDGSVQGVSVRTITTVNGRDWEGDPAPLSGASDPAFVAFADSFAASAVAQRDALQADFDELDQLHKALQDEQLQLTTLHEQTSAQHAELTTLFEALTADHAELTALQAETANERTAIQTQHEQLIDLHAQTLDQRNTLEANLQAITAEHAQLGSDFASVTHQLDSALATIEQLQAELDAIANPPGPDLSTVDGVRQFVSDQRFNIETGGFTVGDQFISTGRDEIGHWFPRFYNAMTWLQGDEHARKGNPDGLYPYKPKNGKPRILSAAQVVRAYECMAWFINMCFAAEEQISRLIDEGTPLEQVLAALPGSWPQRQFQWEAPQ